MNRNYDYEELFGLLSRCTEDVLKSVVFSVALAVPSIRRSLLKMVFTAIILGFIAGAIATYYIQSKM